MQDLWKTLEKRTQLLTNSEYEAFVNKVWVGGDPKSFESLFIATAGLGGETGEVLEKLKKFVRDDKLDVSELEKELGDTLYYLLRIGNYFGLTLDSIIEANVKKLTDRRERNVVHGTGDNR